MPPLRRVLIVSPNWPPLNLPDSQRVRTALPYLEECGWEAHVLCVDPSYVAGPTDPSLADTLPANLRITMVRPFAQRVARWPGTPNVRYRALAALARAGKAILISEPIDVILFSTTFFPSMVLGAYWKWRFNTSYVLDWQDPWYAGRYRRERGSRLPGGRLRYAAAITVARTLEPMALRGAAHVICVSPAYPVSLLERYSWLRADRFSVVPFGAPEADLDLVARNGVTQRLFDPADGMEHWVYAGRIGEDMRLPLGGLLHAIAEMRRTQPEHGARIRLHFIGTSYASGVADDSLVQSLAVRYGVADLVREHPARVPYFEALVCLRDASVVLVLGSADRGYNASKLYLTALTRRPLLSIPQQGTAMHRALDELSGRLVVSFHPGETVERLAGRLLALGLAHAAEMAPGLDTAALAPHTARAMTHRVCTVLDTVTDAAGSSPAHAATLVHSTGPAA